MGPVPAYVPWTAQAAPAGVVLMPLPRAYAPTNVPYFYAVPHRRPSDVKPDTIAPHMDAKGTPIQVDLRRNDYAKRDKYKMCAGYSLLAKPVNDIHLVCHDFPWVIRIKGEWVTCGLVWKRLHENLRERITTAEWGLITRDGNRRRVIEKAMKKRLEENPGDATVPLRIDYVGDLTVFKGLEKDDAYVEKTLMPGRDEKLETWVVRLGRR